LKQESIIEHCTREAEKRSIELAQATSHLNHDPARCARGASDKSQSDLSQENEILVALLAEKETAFTEMSSLSEMALERTRKVMGRSFDQHCHDIVSPQDLASAHSREEALKNRLDLLTRAYRTVWRYCLVFGPDLIAFLSHRLREKRSNCRLR
jgi:hypothetical protein